MYRKVANRNTCFHLKNQLLMGFVSPACSRLYVVLILTHKSLKLLKYVFLHNCQCGSGATFWIFVFSTDQTVDSIQKTGRKLWTSDSVTRLQLSSCNVYGDTEPTSVPYKNFISSSIQFNLLNNHFGLRG